MWSNGDLTYPGITTFHTFIIELLDIRSIPLIRSNRSGPNCNFTTYIAEIGCKVRPAYGFYVVQWWPYICRDHYISYLYYWIFLAACVWRNGYVDYTPNPDNKLGIIRLGDIHPKVLLWHLQDNERWMCYFSTATYYSGRDKSYFCNMDAGRTLMDDDRYQTIFLDDCPEGESKRVLAKGQTISLSYPRAQIPH